MLSESLVTPEIETERRSRFAIWDTVHVRDPGLSGKGSGGLQEAAGPPHLGPREEARAWGRVGFISTETASKP